MPAKSDPRRLRTLVTACGVALLLAGARPAAAAEYYVATDGNDESPGSKAEPFRTIQKAADVVRPGDTVFVRGGVYRETVRVRTSGAEDAPVRFAAAPGESPIVSGTVEMAARWSPYKGSIYKARCDQPVSQLFVDGEMMVEARWPNQPFEKRWDKSTWRATSKGSDYGRIVDPELARTGVDWTGALGVLNVGAWQTFLRPVRGHAAGSDAFEYATDLGKRHESEVTRRKRRKPGFDRYFLFGKLEALDAPGEWFLDRDANTLYLWPLDGKNPSGRRIEGKSRDYAFIAAGRRYVRIDGFRFFAATFLFEKSDHCVVENCDLEYPTYAGLTETTEGTEPYVPERTARMNRHFLGGLRSLAPTLVDGSGNVIRNCRIGFSEGPGVMLAGSENTIENCLIHDVDWRGLGNGVAANCGAVRMSTSARSVFRRNTVHHFGCSEGIILPSVGPSVCEYNYVHHGGLVQSDGGLIQCHGVRLDGTVIRYNWVHDHVAFHWGGIGIRGDDLTRNLIVHHNVAWRCNAKGIMIKGDHNQVYNNSCFDNPQLDLVLWSAEEPFKEWAKGQWAHLIKRQNEHSKAFNNYAPVLTGQMQHEVRRARKLLLPAGELSHNFRPPEPMLLDARKLVFRDDAPILANPAAFDFRPRKGSPLVDAGRVIPGITDGHKGAAPDIGAYEHDGPRWIPGCRNGLWLSATSQDAGGAASLRVALCMPPLEPVRLAVSRGGRRIGVLEFGPEDWMTPQRVALGGGTGKVLLHDRYLGSVTLGDAALGYNRSPASPAPSLPVGEPQRQVGRPRRSRTVLDALAGPWRRVWFDRPMLPAGGAGPPSASGGRQKAR